MYQNYNIQSSSDQIGGVATWMRSRANNCGRLWGWSWEENFKARKFKNILLNHCSWWLFSCLFVTRISHMIWTLIHKSKPNLLVIHIVIWDGIGVSGASLFNYVIIWHLWKKWHGLFDNIIVRETCSWRVVPHISRTHSKTVSWIHVHTIVENIPTLFSACQVRLFGPEVGEPIEIFHN